MLKKRKQIKAKWEWVNAADAKEGIQAAFDIIFSQVEESQSDDALPPADPSSESDR